MAKQFQLRGRALAAFQAILNRSADGEALFAWLAVEPNLRKVAEMSGTAIPEEKPAPSPAPPPEPSSPAPPLPQRKPAPQLPQPPALIVVETKGELVNVERQKPLKYPGYSKGLKFPTLEKTGPTSYRLASLVPWIHDGQRASGRVSGKVILQHLQATGLINRCLGLSDGLAIIACGLEAFQASPFKGMIVYLWRSAISGGSGVDYVPYIKKDENGKLVQGWEEVHQPDQLMANNRVAAMFPA